MSVHEDFSHLRPILRAARTVAVVGLSPRTDRPSHMVAAYLQRQGWLVVPINAAFVQQAAAAGQPPTILGQHCHATLAEAAQYLQHQGLEPIEVVNCFRKSEEMPALAEQAIAIGAQCLWMQQGIAHATAAARARAAGLLVVQDRCIKIDHQRVLSRPNLIV